MHERRPRLRAPTAAVALRSDDIILPARGRGRIILTAACPRTRTAWTSTGTPREPRGLKRRANGAIRVVPIPLVLARMPRLHLRQFGTVELDRGMFQAELERALEKDADFFALPRDATGADVAAVIAR